MTLASGSARAPPTISTQRSAFLPTSPRTLTSCCSIFPTPCPPFIHVPSSRSASLASCQDRPQLGKTTTGFNKLGHTLTVNSFAQRPSCSSQVGFLASSSYSKACAENLSIQDVSLTSGNYQSMGPLTARQSSIAQGNAVLLQSDTSIGLGNGFAVPSGAQFQAKLAVCN